MARHLDCGLFSNPGIEAWGEATSTFLTGKAAMLMTSTASVTGIRSGAEENGFEVDNAFYPTIDGDRTGPVIGGASWSFPPDCHRSARTTSAASSNPWDDRSHGSLAQGAPRLRRVHRRRRVASPRKRRRRGLKPARLVRPRSTVDTGREHAGERRVSRISASRGPAEPECDTARRVAGASRTRRSRA